MASYHRFSDMNRVNENKDVVVDGYIRELQTDDLFIPNSINGICSAYCRECYSLFFVSSPDCAYEDDRDIAECTARLVHDNIQLLATSFSSIHLTDNNYNHMVEGFNDCNQLGFSDDKLRHTENHLLRMNDFFNNKNMKIKYITNSHAEYSKHMFVQTDSNQIYSFGDNRKSQCGYKMNDSDSDEQVEPKLVHFFVQHKVNVIDIKKGDRHTLFLSNDRMIYGCGSNKQYQMGLPQAKVYHEIVNVSQHTNFPKSFKQPVKQMECQDSSSFFLDSNDILYGVGENDCGQLGMDGISTTTNVRKVDIRSRVKQFKCGGGHVCLMDEKYNIITFGLNMCGQCGVPLGHASRKTSKWQTKYVYKPTVINSFFVREDGRGIYKIDDQWKIICGYYSTYIIDANCNLYVCGDNGTGGCMMDDVSKIHVPTFMNNKTILEKYTDGKHIVSVVGSYEGVYLITL